MIEELLIKHEGLKLKPYKCTAGKTTLGVGRNIEDNGITKEEALYLLRNDIETCRQEASQYPWYNGLSEPRKDVVISMIFNLGLYRFSKFKNTIKALENKDYPEAARQMLDSRWANQVGNRAVELAKMMEES